MIRECEAIQMTQTHAMIMTTNKILKNHISYPAIRDVRFVNPIKPVLCKFPICNLFQEYD